MLLTYKMTGYLQGVGGGLNGGFNTVYIGSLPSSPFYPFFSRFLFISSSTRKPFHSSVIAHAHLIYKTTEHLRATFLPNLISPYFA